MPLSFIEDRKRKAAEAWRLGFEKRWDDAVRAGAIPYFDHDGVPRLCIYEPGTNHRLRRKLRCDL